MIDRRTLAATALVAVCGAGPGQAQAKAFDIAVQPVALALSEFGRQADVQIVAARRLTDGKQANAVHGTMTVPVALNRMIEGTGLAARRTSAQTYALAAAQDSRPAAPPVPAVDPAPGNDANIAPITDEAVADIVVTGSSIRGVPPTGSNLIQIGAEDVVNTGATTTQDLLANVPQLGTFNTAPSPGQRGNSSLSTGPNIRGLGQAATLPLVNGHRIVSVGALQNLPDPSLVPPSAIQRVEIIADGASATYGSDAVAGVVNVITRRDYHGLSATARYGIGDDYHTYNANVATGGKWAGGGMIISAEYSVTSRLRASDRDFLTNDFSSTGGQDFRAIGNSCIPATYRVNNAAGVATGSYIQPATGATDPRCTSYQYGDLYPRQKRIGIFSAGHQEVGDRVEISYDAFYSRTNGDSYGAPTFVSGIMTRANPFFPANLPASVTSITAYYSPYDLTNTVQRALTKLTTYGGTLTADVKLPHDFKWTTFLTGSRNSTIIHDASFDSRLNSQLINATSTATALDPFGGRTSAQSRANLLNYENHLTGKQSLWEANSKLDGTLIRLPGGDLKIALGGVYRVETYDGLFASAPIGTDLNAQRGSGMRKVWSAFGELFVPIVGDENGVMFLRNLELSVSGRIDHYNDFGTTKNPKLGLRWVPVRGLALRGSFGTSFHAPALNDLYAPDTRAGYLAQGTLAPGLPQGSVPGGIFIAGGDPNLGPEKARTWSFGADLTPAALPGFRASASWYYVLYKDRISTPSRTFYTDPNFRRFIVDNIVCDGGTYPSGTNCRALPLDPALVYSLIKDIPKVDFPNAINSAADIPAIYNVTLLRRANLSLVKTAGIDFDTSYRWKMGRTDLQAGIQGNYVLRYDQAAISSAALVDQFPLGQQRFRARGSLNAHRDPFSATVAVNYTGPYHLAYTSFAGPIATEKVGSFTTADLHLGWQLGEDGILKDFELFADVENLLDAQPPYIRSVNGYGTGNVLGRVVTFGARKKF